MFDDKSLFFNTCVNFCNIKKLIFLFGSDKVVQKLAAAAEMLLRPQQDTFLYVHLPAAVQCSAVQCSAILCSAAGPDIWPEAPAEAGIFNPPLGPLCVVNPLGEAVR